MNPVSHIEITVSNQKHTFTVYETVNGVTKPRCYDAIVNDGPATPLYKCPRNWTVLGHALNKAFEKVTT